MSINQNPIAFIVLEIYKINYFAYEKMSNFYKPSSFIRRD